MEEREEEREEEEEEEEVESGGGGGKGQRSRRILPDMQTADVEQSAMATDTQRRSLAMTSITS